jgi:type II secretory pathway pseudopilin PulG
MIEMLVVLAITGIMAAMALPSLRPAAQGDRLLGDARTLAHNMSLAKMRAAASFTRTRLRVDISARQYSIERWNGTGWESDGESQVLSSGVSFGHSGITQAPPHTQTTIGEHLECYDNASPPVAISGTQCVVFNSRGVPINPLTSDALGGNGVYLTDGTAVYGSMVGATGLTNLWWTPYVTPPSWQKQK